MVGESEEYRRGYHDPVGKPSYFYEPGSSTWQGAKARESHQALNDALHSSRTDRIASTNSDGPFLQGLMISMGIAGAIFGPVLYVAYSNQIDAVVHEKINRINTLWNSGPGFVLNGLWGHPVTASLAVASCFIALDKVRGKLGWKTAAKSLATALFIITPTVFNESFKYLYARADAEFYANADYGYANKANVSVSSGTYENLGATDKMHNAICGEKIMIEKGGNTSTGWTAVWLPGKPEDASPPEEHKRNIVIGYVRSADLSASRPATCQPL